jgi:CHAD domain-containing protein
MSRVVEIVLDVPACAAHTGHRRTLGAVSAQQASCPGGVSEALGQALSRATQFSPRLSRVENAAPMSIYPMDLSGRLTEAGWGAWVEASSGGWRLIVSCVEPHSPAVAVREIVCDARLEAGVPFTHYVSGLPSKLQQALESAGAFVPLHGVPQVRRTRWRWMAQDGLIVELVLNAFDVAMRSTLTLCCELRLSAYREGSANASSEGEQPDSLEPAIHALFAAAQVVLAELPAFPVIESVLEGTRRNREEADEPVRAMPVDLIDVHTPHAALIAISANLAHQWFGNERGVREGATTEFVHQMRVAQRRLRTTLRIFSAWADADWTTRVVPELRWLGKRLGEVRDLDVFTDSTLPALAAADLDVSTWSTVLAEAAALRSDARQHLQAAMGSRRYAQLSLTWLAWLAELPLRGVPDSTAGVTLREFVKRRVRKHFKRLTGTSKLSELDAHARHCRRIEAKRSVCATRLNSLNRLRRHARAAMPPGSCSGFKACLAMLTMRWLP